MNILIMSCGTRKKIVQYFREVFHEYGGKVFAADCSELAPALYEADEYFIDKRMGESGYLAEVMDICKTNRIDGILSLIDPELGILAQHEGEFKSIGTTVIGSPYELCEVSLDKMRMHEWLKAHKYKCARSWMDKEEFFRSVDRGEVSYPVFVKPYKGSASNGISEVYDKEAIEVLYAYENDLMIQEYLNGREIGADVYVDMFSGEVISIFTKKKIKMRAGETDKSVSFKDGRLFDLIERFVADAGYRGQVDIDIFDVDGQYYISEVNPRFGGGYPHAYESGCDHMTLILNNLAGKVNEKNIGAYEEGIYMMKYDEVKILKT